MIPGFQNHFFPKSVYVFPYFQAKKCVESVKKSVETLLNGAY